MTSSVRCLPSLFLPYLYVESNVLQPTRYNMIELGYFLRLRAGQEERGTTEDKMVGWHHRLNGHGFGWTLGVGDGQGDLACCSSWHRKKSDMTERLN